MWLTSNNLIPKTHKQLLFVSLLVLMAPVILFFHRTYTICDVSSQSSKDRKAEIVLTKAAKNTTSIAVKKTKQYKYKVTTRIPTQQKDLCSDYQELYSQCDPTILHHVSTLSLLPQNKKKFLQSLTLSKKNPNKSNRVQCPRMSLKRFNSSLTTGLVSHPGSGNTWTRYLIQQLTGYLTGAIYNASVLRNYGFPGEGLRENVIVVKTHVTDKKNNFLELDRRIVVVRNPYDSILAEFKRHQLKLGHTKSAHVLRKDEQKKWEIEFKRAIADWILFMNIVFRNSSKPTLILFYEDMITCLPSELIKLAKFLKTDVLNKFSMCCVLKNSEGNNHRNHKDDQLSADTVYSKSQQQQMDQTLELIGSQLKSTYPKVAQRLYNYRREKK